MMSFSLVCYLLIDYDFHAIMADTHLFCHHCMRDRQPSGISLQEVRTEMQMSLLQHTGEGEPAREAAVGRKVVYRDGVAEYIWEGKQRLPNVVRNQKYSMLTFLPKVLFQQFQYFFNFFYLVTALSQFIPALKVGLLFSFVAPLVLVLSLTMLKEAYEDLQRYKKDKELNSALYSKMQGSRKVEVPAGELKVGDILQLGVGDNLPADCLFLASLSEKPTLFIKTDQLDGETDWKLRKPALPVLDLASLTLEFTVPCVNVYQFVGSVCVGIGEEAVGVGLQQTLWRGVKVASGRGLAVVLYVGGETKLSLNSKEAGNKFGAFDNQLNLLSKLLFVMLVSLSIVMVILRGSYGTPGESAVLMFKYLLLLSSIIPISMRVNLDFARLVYKLLIDHDPLMPGCLCRNSNIPEELGRISYVLTDKTGTLTQNQMIFRRLMLSPDLAFDSQDASQLRFLASERENLEDIKVQRVQRAVQALLLCHNVTPVLDNGLRNLQGSSPDELTLVSFAESLGFQIKERSQDSLELLVPEGQARHFDILEMFPFSSDSKSMGIMVRQAGKITYYLKGADSVMGSKISPADAHFMAEACLDLAHQGLRTLVIAQRQVTPEYYSEWKKELTAAGASLKNRQEKVAACRRRLQQGMTFVGVTGVQDKLQVGVNQTVGSLRSIGIRVWMLTGDKVETAICVGRAVRLIQGREERLFLIENAKTRGQFLSRLEEFYTCVGMSREEAGRAECIPCVLVIDGTSLRWALEQIAQEFFEIAVKLPAIICSRVSPTQKAEVALLVRQWGSGRVLGIGDGGNDVALIQSAHVGVGIYGKEGIQAALASDFSISTFADLNGLIYWHGRLAYKRSSLLSQFIIHRGLIITIMQAIFSIQFFFVALPIFNGFLLLGYSTIFTMLPVFSLVLDEDISRAAALTYPALYKSTQAGNELNAESFIYWLIISVYQGAIIMILIDLLVGVESFFMVSTISFTCLIFIEFLNLLTELHRIRLLQIGSIIISVIIYLCAMLLMRRTLNGAQLFSTSYLPATLVIVLVAWSPPFVYQQLKRWTSPTLEQKIMSQSSILPQ